MTTVVTGNCGVSLAPLTLDHDPPPPLDLIGGWIDYGYPTFAAYLAALDERRRRSTRPASSGIRRCGWARCPARPAGDEAEIARMGEWLQEALDAGAVGMSTGLFYAPAFHAPPDEIKALARLLKPAGALYTTHMRDEASTCSTVSTRASMSGATPGCRS